MKDTAKLTFDVFSNTLTIEDGTISYISTLQFCEDTEHVILKGKVVCNNCCNLFNQFEKLVDITGRLDTSNCKDFEMMYAECQSLIKPIENLDTSKGEDFAYMHSSNYSLESVHFNSTLNGSRFEDMFMECPKLKEIHGVKISLELNLELCLDSVTDNELVKDYLKRNII